MASDLLKRLFIIVILMILTYVQGNPYSGNFIFLEILFIVSFKHIINIGIITKKLNHHLATHVQASDRSIKVHVYNLFIY